MPTVRRLAIFGRVQAVGYRAWAVQQAQSLGLRGYVRNRRDGTVEALACGPEAAVSSFAEACRQGPPLALVERVDIAEADETECGTAFRQLPSS
jgi:acylphosphatase